MDDRAGQGASGDGQRLFPLRGARGAILPQGTDTAPGPAYLPVPTGSTVIDGPASSETGTWMLTGNVWEWVSLGG